VAAGEERNYRVTGSLSALLGNSGAVDVEWGGRDLGPLGRSGQVRVIRFESTGEYRVESRR